MNKHLKGKISILWFHKEKIDQVEVSKSRVRITLDFVQPKQLLDLYEQTSKLLD